MKDFNEYMQVALYIAIGVIYLLSTFATMRRKRQARAQKRPRTVIEPQEEPMRPAEVRERIGRQTPKSERTMQAQEIRYFTYENTDDFNSARKQAAEPETDDSEQQGSDEGAHGFDLREAVIYSEILKPKFED